MKSLKKFVENQSFMLGNRGYQWIFIKHNLTPNPILLKTFILRDFLDCLVKWKDVDKYSEYKSIKTSYNMLLKLPLSDIRIEHAILKQLSDKIIDACYRFTDVKGISDVRPLARDNCKFYLLLLLYEHYAILNNLEYKNFMRYIKTNLLPNMFPNQDDCRYKLCLEALKQIEKTYIPHDFRQIHTNNYLTYLEATEDTYLDVEYYCSNSNYINNESSKMESLSYYADLYLYDFLNEITLWTQE